jgi:hypothetical protein
LDRLRERRIVVGSNGQFTSSGVVVDYDAKGDLLTTGCFTHTATRLTAGFELVNRLISVNYSFRHVGTIRLTLAPHPLEILFHLHGISITCT